MAVSLIKQNLYPPGSYRSLERAEQVYSEAFKKCFEYIEGSGIEGDVIEFGTLGGFTANIIAELIRVHDRKSHLYLFDSFEGLPEIESDVDKSCYEVVANNAWSKGVMGMPKGTEKLIAKRLKRKHHELKLTVVKGFFESTLDEHLPNGKVSLIHIDCDLYASTKFVLDKIVEKDLLQDGCIIMFDDWNCNRANNNMGERKALADSKIKNYSPFFSYGWHGQAFFIHNKEIV